MQTAINKPDPIARLILGIILLIGTIFIIASLSSCSVFRKVNKDIQKADVKTKIETNTDTKITETSTKTADSTIHQPGSVVTGQKPLDNIVKGDSLVTENAQVKSTVKYDKKTGNIHVKTEAKPQDIHIKVNENKTKVTESKSKTQEKTKSNTVQKKVAKTSFNLWWLLLLLIPAGLYIFRKKVPFLKTFFIKTLE
jgi:archaellum component FlaF (FlaF/FlaG flagellin family)